MNIHKQVMHILEFVVAPELYMFCIECDLEEYFGDIEVVQICSPWVRVIQKAMINNSPKIPRFTNSEFRHLSNLILGTYSTNEMISKCWDRYLDSCIHVCMWIDAKQEEFNIRSTKEQLLLEHGFPPYIDESSFLTLHEPLASLPSFFPLLKESSNCLEKTLVNIIFLGDVGSGKSTITFNFIYNVSGVNTEVLEEFRKHSQMESNYNRWKFETSFFAVNVINASISTQKLVSGTLKADCAILVVSAGNEISKANIFENGSALEQLRFADDMGVKHLIVAVNKMDLTEPPYSKTRFLEIKKEVSNFLKKTNFRPDAVLFIPMSGFFGENVLEYSESLYWYKGWKCRSQNTAEGTTLREALDATLLPALSTSNTLICRSNISTAIHMGAFDSSSENDSSDSGFSGYSDNNSI